MANKPKADARDSGSGKFLPGRSGNPQGRPRKALTVGAIMANAFAESVSVSENGKRRKITKLQATAKQIANRSAAGDARIAKLGLELAQKAETAQKQVDALPALLSESDQEIVERVLKRMREIVEEKIRAQHDADSN